MRPEQFLGQRPLRSAGAKIKIALLVLLPSLVLVGLISGRLLFSNLEEMGIYCFSIPEVGDVTYLSGESCTINMKSTTSTDDANLLFQHCLEVHQSLFEK